MHFSDLIFLSLWSDGTNVTRGFKIDFLKSKNPQTFVTETFKTGIVKFQGFCVSVTSNFHHFEAMQAMWQEVSKLTSVKSKNPSTFVTETFKTGTIKF